jgi:hypothetical protein
MPTAHCQCPLRLTTANNLPPPLVYRYMREVPVSFESLLENNGDPSHVFFTHHGVLAKRDDSVPISLHLTEEGREQGVFTFKVEGPAFPIVKLLPPAMLWWVTAPYPAPCALLLLARFGAVAGGGASGYRLPCLMLVVCAQGSPVACTMYSAAPSTARLHGHMPPASCLPASAKHPVAQSHR